jgi:hypothetical protein
LGDYPETHYITGNYAYFPPFSNWCPHEESNLDLRFRKPVFYPLNYGGDGKEAEVRKALL